MQLHSALGKPETDAYPCLRALFWPIGLQFYLEELLKIAEYAKKYRILTDTATMGRRGDLDV